MRSLEAMTEESNTSYLGDLMKLKIAQSVVGAIADKGSNLKFIPYTMQVVKQGYKILEPLFYLINAFDSIKYFLIFLHWLCIPS